MRRAMATAMLLAIAWTATAEEVPGDSLYQLRPALVDQGGGATRLDVFHGRPVLVSMFYASCPNVCPLLIGTLQRIERELTEASRAELRVVLVSFDPDGDTPQALAALAAERGIDLMRWKLVRASADDVRLLAAALGVQHRKLPDGNFNHSTIITLLDRRGRIAAQTAQLGAVDEDFVDRVRAVLAPRPESRAR